ncbi:MAG: hypothetical protein ABI811_24295 [Acidobacteriota bacterium]
MKVQTNGIRTDVLRGIRWAGILAVVGLLLVTAFRIIQLNPADAKPPVPVAAQVGEPAIVEVTPLSEIVLPPTVEGSPAPSGRAARPKAPKRVETIPVPVPIPLSAPNPNAGVPVPVGPQPAAALAEPPALLTVQPAAFVASPAVVVPAPVVIAPPPSASSKAKVEESDQAPGRTGRIVRSVGRMFGVGRKADKKK